MKIKTLTKELESTTHFKTLKEKNPDTFLTAIFSILNLEDPAQNQIQLDYFLPKSKQIAAFHHPFKEEPKIHSDIISVQSGKTTPKKIEQMSPQDTNPKPDLDNLEKEIKTILEKEKSKITPTKIIAILKDDTWNLTCMDNALGIIRLKLDAKTGSQTDFNKGSLMDFMGMKKK